MATKIGTQIGSALDVINDGRSHALLDRATDQRGYDFIFGRADAPITNGHVVHINGLGSAARLTNTLAATAGVVAVAQNSFVTADYGWFMIRGKAILLLAASCADDVPLYTTDTAGVLDDATASLTHHQIMGIIADASASAGVTSVSCFVSWPITRRPAA